MVADVGARIRSLRTAKGLTQAQVAEPQYTKAYISMLESGRTRASMKALEHIAGVLGVKPADLLGGRASPATPQFTLLEARRLLEERHADGAIPLLEGLEEGLTPQDQLVRLRYLAAAYNATAQPKQAFPVIERAQRMADLLNDPEEQVRIKSVLAAAYERTYAYEEQVRLLRECVQACEDGTVKDVTFHYRRLVDLALALGNQRQSKQALAVYEQAFVLAEQFGDLPTTASLYAGMAKAYHDSGDVEAAIMASQKSLDIYEQLGLLDQMACALDNAAALYVEYGNLTRARDCLARAAGLAEQARRDGTLASIRASEAEVLAKGDTAEALEGAQTALKFARKVGQVDAEVRMLVLIGELRMKANGAAARRSFQEARQLAEERAPHLLRVIFDRWSRAAEASGDSDEALRLARRALDTVRV
jgi:transcriptional regulator with XRE-family HTH domain